MLVINMKNVISDFIKKEWKDITCLNSFCGGLYKIINKVNGKYYVGSTNNIKRRLRRHKYDLRNNVHSNLKFQRSWNKHGEENFEFYVIENIEENQLLVLEQKLLNIAELTPEQCYNLTFGTGRIKHTEESKARISKAMIGREKSETTRKKLSEGMMGEKNHRFGIPQNPNIYKFRDRLTNNFFEGTLMDFKRIYNLPNINCLVKTKKRNSYKNWILVK